MKQIAYEIRRQFRSPIGWGVVFFLVLTVLAYMTGTFYNFFSPRWFVQNESSAMDVYLFQPLCNATLLSGLCVSLYAITDLNRIKRNGVGYLVDSIIDPGKRYFAQTIGLLSVISAGCILGFVTLYPLCKEFLGPFLLWKEFAFFWFVFYWMGLLIFLLFSVALYMMTENILGSMGTVGIVALLPPQMYRIWPGKLATLLQWIQTPVNNLSDGSGNVLAHRLILYYRWVWVLIAGTVYALGQCLLRRNGRVHGTGGKVKPKLPAVIAFSVLAIVLVGTLDSEFGIMSGGLRLPGISKIDSETGFILNPTFYTSLYSETECLEGTVDIVLDGKKGSLALDGTFLLDSPKETAAYMQIPAGTEVTQLSINGLPVIFACDSKNEEIMGYCYFNIPAGEIELQVEYSGIPKNYYIALDSVISESYINIDLYYPNNPDSKMEFTMTMPADLVVYSGIFDDTAQKVDNGDGTATYYSRLPGGSTHILAGKYIEEQFEVGNYNVTYAYFETEQELMKISGAKDALTNVISAYHNVLGRARRTTRPNMIIAESANTKAGLGSYGYTTVFFYPEADIWQRDISGRPLTENGVSIADVAKLIAEYWWYGRISDEEFYSWSKEGMHEYSAYLALREISGEEHATEAFVDKWVEDLSRIENSYYYANPKVRAMLPSPVKDSLDATDNEVRTTANSALILYDMQNRAEDQEIFLTKLKSVRERALDENHSVGFFDLITAMGLEAKDVLEWNEELGQYSVKELPCNYPDANM